MSMVTYLQRPGDQDQLSMFTTAARPDDATLRRVVDYALHRPDDDLSTLALAERVNISPRQLSRLFRSTWTKPPARRYDGSGSSWQPGCSPPRIAPSATSRAAAAFRAQRRFGRRSPRSTASAPARTGPLGAHAPHNSDSYEHSQPFRGSVLTYDDRLASDALENSCPSERRTSPTGRSGRKRTGRRPDGHGYRPGHPRFVRTQLLTAVNATGSSRPGRRHRALRGPDAVPRRPRQCRVRSRGPKRHDGPGPGRCSEQPVQLRSVAFGATGGQPRRACG